MASLFETTPYLSFKIWGGSRLEFWKNLQHKEHPEPVGETWEVSALPEGECLLEGVPCSQKIDGEHLPYICKYIDTSDYLSVQVHPNDQKALELEGVGVGKSECWFILEADGQSGIYLGLKQESSWSNFKRDLLAGNDIRPYLRFFPVSRGEFFFVPAGTIHAIGPGILLAEVQQRSGITYRVWDWNRVDAHGKSRELHVEKAMASIDFDSTQFQQQQGLFEKKGHYPLATHRDFNVEFLHLGPRERFEWQREKNHRYHSLLCLEGEGIVNQEEGKTTLLQQRRSYIVDNHGEGEETLSLRSKESGIKLLLIS